jgi:hypothetical protein
MKRGVFESVVGSMVLACLVNWCLALDQFNYDVYFINDEGIRLEGQLRFTEDQVTFESIDGMDSKSWQYADMTAIDLKKPRLFKFKLANSKSVSFSPIGGEQHFERALGNFLREKNQKAKVKM